MNMSPPPLIIEFATLLHKQSSKSIYVYHFIADSNVTYQELEKNSLPL